MTPTWPVLAGWMQTVSVRTATGRWRTEDGEGEFTFRSPDTWTGQRMWGGEIWARGDYCRPVGPVTEAVHDGRLCWRVDLEPPTHKRGVLTLLVDDETGLRLHSSNSEFGHLAEVLDLVLDPPLGPLPPVREVRDPQRQLYELCSERPPPTPRWFPWRRSHAGAQDLRVIGDGAVGRAPSGQVAPAEGHRHVVRLEHGGWSWAVSSEAAMDEPTARLVVQQVGHEAPPSWPWPDEG